MSLYKIVILNAVGNTGKSTIASELLKPRMPNAELVRIETINSHGQEDHDHKVSARSAEQIWSAIDMSDQTIIDVGASNYEMFMQRLNQLHGAHEDFDIFLVPTTPDPKAQEDTLTTVDMLCYLGVEPERIRIIFNKLDDFELVEDVYSKIFARHDIVEMLNLSSAKNTIAIRESAAFTSAGEHEKRLSDIAKDNTDYRALMRTCAREERMHYSSLNTLKRMAISTEKELDNVFDRLLDSIGITKESLVSPS